MHRILLALGLAGLAFAQTGQITGLVSDSAGTPTPGAKVAVINIDTGIKRETSTNDQGYYTFALLNPGNYELSVQKTGFKEFFNLTNTPAFGGPVTNIEAATVGRILSAGEPRDIQFALKLSF